MGVRSCRDVIATGTRAPRPVSRGCGDGRASGVGAVVALSRSEHASNGRFAGRLSPMNEPRGLVTRAPVSVIRRCGSEGGIT